MSNLIDRRTLLTGLGAAAFAGPALAQVAAGVSIPSLAAARPESVGISSKGLAKIDALVADFIDRKKVPGVVTAVARRNRLVQFQAYGVSDPGSGAPMRADSMFLMMSSTKPVTGVALLQQIEAGRVRLDDPISKFLPELKRVRGVAKPGLPPLAPGKTYTDDQIEPQTREITIKDLATHTSGLNAIAPREPQDTLATYIPRLKDAVLEFQPGARWGYSAVTGADVLARVVEITAGLPYDRYLKQHIFDPIGMKDTTYALTDEQSARQVKLYRPHDGKWVPLLLPGFTGETSPYKPGSFGLVSTAGDYLLFESMLLSKGSIHGKRVLKPSSVELMRTNLVGDLYKGFDGREKGAGFGVLVRVVLDSAIANDVVRETGAFGWQGAFGTMTWTDPALDLVAVLMLEYPDPDLQREFQRIIRAAVLA